MYILDCRLRFNFLFLIIRVVIVILPNISTTAIFKSIFDWIFLDIITLSLIWVYQRCLILILNTFAAIFQWILSILWIIWGSRYHFLLFIGILVCSIRPWKVVWIRLGSLRINLYLAIVWNWIFNLILIWYVRVISYTSAWLGVCHLNYFRILILYI